MVPRANRAQLLLFGLILAFGVRAFASSVETPESTVRRFLALAYDGQFDNLPVAGTTSGIDRFRRRVRNQLRVRCMRIEDVSLVVHTKGAGEVAVDANVLVEKRDSLTPAPWFAVDEVRLRIELAHRNETWSITDVRNLDEDLADQLLSNGAAERERLLRAQPERISKGLARAIYARALALLNSGKFTEGAHVTALARQIAVAAGDRGGEALAIGLSIHTHPPDAWESIDHVAEEAIAIAETTGDAEVLARVWYDRGRSVQVKRFRSDKILGNSAALDYRRSLELASRSEDPLMQMRVLYSLANAAANSQCDYLAARRYADRGLAIAREFEDVGGEAGLEMVLSTIYLWQGDRERGLFHHTRALELAKSAGTYAYATLMIRSGVLLAEDERFDDAQRVLAQAVTRTDKGARSAIGTVPGPVLGAALRAFAAIEARKGNLSEAICLARESADHHGGDPNVYLYELAPFCLKRGDNETALALSLASLSVRGLYSSQKVTALISAGRAYRNLHDVERGLDAALEAIALREGIDAKIAGDQLQRAYASTAIAECYELAAELELDRHDPEQALVYFERGRARVLTDILENGRPESMAEADTAGDARLAALDREVAGIHIVLDRARNDKNEKAVAELTERLHQIRAARASFADGLLARSERRGAARREVDRAGLLDLIATLPARSAAVEYIVGERDLHIFAISRDPSGKPRVIARTRPIPRKAVEQSVTSFLDRLSGNDLRVNVSGREVYELLIQPIENEIAGVDALLVLPDEILWRVPFAALVDGRSRFLAERLAVMYAPSLTAFASITESRRKRESQPVSFFAVANPAFDAEVTKTAASFYRSATLGPLPEAEEEVDAVRALYDSRHSLVLKGDDATEARTKTALREARIAHFATHAILDDANPMYSRLMLAHDGQAIDDGWLESWEVAQLDLDADMVVLSACETARGRVGGGEGVMSLSWAFFLAGAHSTVATQWKVASNATAQFMIAFHRAFRAPAANPALHKAQSLRAAQLQLLRDKRTRHPFHWAAFVLLGDASVQEGQP